MIAALQRALRWAFMHGEALFNAAFGERINPLYHLGAIIFFLFWLAAGSGLYLYVFFDTGVPEAYQSVEQLTHGQWYLGGILGSTHRYASDGIVLVMAVHLVRHFAFDRLRGFRWFAWVTGVGLIGFVYVSGINGYMLPWDRLAQFTIVGSFEWLDRLPGFGGALSRNFIYPESVDDRFFSLLSFVHIGAPLLTLLLMWVHIQRVPKASTQPPRPVALALVASLVVLALLKPALSQGGVADLATDVAQVGIDWFYLVLFPLFDRWSAGQVWLLLVVAMLVLVALPWLPPRRSSGAGWQVEMHPGAHRVDARPGETLLEAGLRAGLALPYGCRNGACGVCVCRVLHGRVDPGHFQPGALGASMHARGEALMCCASALEDVAIEVDVPSLVPGDAPEVRSLDARVERLTRLAPDVMQVLLSLPAGARMPFAAGQYLNIVLEDGQRRAFSFANPPQQETPIELHVRRVEGGLFTPRVFDGLKPGDILHIEGPHGRFTLRPGERPILFVAGATGFAPIRSIVEDAFARGIDRPMWLYWGGRGPADLYARAEAERWQREHAGFHFVPVLSEAGMDGSWHGRTGPVHRALLEDFPDLAGHELYVCGSVQMVTSAVPDFLAHGLSEQACFSDAFQPAAAPPS